MHNFKPLKITFLLENDAMIGDSPVDSIFAKLYIERLKQNGLFDGNYDVSLPFLKETDGIYHASKLYYHIKHISNSFISKKFELDMYRKYGDKPDLKSVENAASGPFKSYLVNSEVKNIDSAWCFVYGAPDEICSLLSNLKHLGKKSSIGFGKISKIIVEETEQDMSILNEKGQLMRHLPESHPLVPKSGNNKKAFMQPTFPYWKRGSETICVRSQF